MAIIQGDTVNSSDYITSNSYRATNIVCLKLVFKHLLSNQTNNSVNQTEFLLGIFLNLFLEGASNV